MNTTQQHLSITDIQDDILLLKDGGGALVLQVSAVNFGLLSDREQIAIIAAFAQMLNSLSFSIQIILHSERLNITSYLELLDKAQKAQTNPLLSKMITQYKQFIQSTIKENEVLDKKFYLVIPLFALELGITASKEKLEQKTKTVLLPRRDQIIRQLGRVGLKTNQLTGQKLIEVFYGIYNEEILEQSVNQPADPKQLAVKLKQPQLTTDYRLPASPAFGVASQRGEPTTAAEDGRQKMESIPTPPTATQSSRTHPFVVEELE